MHVRMRACTHARTASNTQMHAYNIYTYVHVDYVVSNLFNPFTWLLYIILHDERRLHKWKIQKK